MGDLIRIDEYLERKAGPNRQDITKRLAAIALQQLTLASEKTRLEAILFNLEK